MSKKKQIEPKSETQAEAVRLLNVEGVVGRNMAKRIGIQHQQLSDIRNKRIAFSDTMARRIIRGFRVFAGEVRPFWKGVGDAD